MATTSPLCCGIWSMLGKMQGINKTIVCIVAEVKKKSLTHPWFLSHWIRNAAQRQHKSTTQCMSPRRNWDYPIPSTTTEPGGGGGEALSPSAEKA